MKPRGVLTVPVERNDDVRKFFDSMADEYMDQHGNPGRLLKYRLGIIEREALIRERDIILELGCGTGEHLMALAEISGGGVGIDFSPKMVEAANKRILEKKLNGKISCRVDNAISLGTLENDSFDKAICVGSLEHIPDKQAVIDAVYRVLKPSGSFVCLTVNGGYIWYSKIAPFLNFSTRHFSSDRFLKRSDIDAMLSKSLFIQEKTGYWSFIPRGDMPTGIGLILHVLDLIGRFFMIRRFRGGIFFTVVKPKEIRDEDLAPGIPDY